MVLLPVIDCFRVPVIQKKKRQERIEHMTSVCDVCQASSVLWVLTASGPYKGLIESPHTHTKRGRGDRDYKENDNKRNK